MNVEEMERRLRRGLDVTSVDALVTNQQVDALVRELLPHLMDRPEPVVAPLPSEAVAIIEEFQTRAEAFKGVNEGVRSAYLNAADMVRRLVPEEDEDTVRVPCGCGYSGFGGGHRDTCPAGVPTCDGRCRS